jgi:hypothetical protein
MIRRVLRAAARLVLGPPPKGKLWKRGGGWGDVR